MSTASVLLLSLQLWGAILALQGCGGGGDGGGGGDAPAAEAGTPGPDCKGGSPGDNIAENQDKWHADCGPDEVRADLAPTGGCECITETPAFLYNEDGTYVAEAHKLYGKFPERQLGSWVGVAGRVCMKVSASSDSSFSAVSTPSFTTQALRFSTFRDLQDFQMLQGHVTN